MGEAMGLRRGWLVLVALALWPACARAIANNAQGWCETGAQYVTLNGLLSTTTVQASYPSCTVTVYVHGGGLATIYSDQNLSVPLANPFTASTIGQWIFYAANGYYDITLSSNGTQLATYSGVLIGWPTTIEFASLSTSQLNNLLYVDGTIFPLTAAGINAADALLGTSPGTIFVTYAGFYCDTTAQPSNNHSLVFSPGTYSINIAGVDSTTTNVSWGVTGAGSNQTTLLSCPGSNRDVITSQHFSTFTGGTNFYGVYHPVIGGLTIDGNKLNETTSGYGVRLYTRSPAPFDLLTQNCFNDGQWWEWGGTESDTSAGTSVNGNGVILESDYNTGNGITFKTSTTNPGSLNAVANIITHNNGGWGIQVQYPITVGQINSYENVSGGCDLQAPNGALIASNASCDTATGWGLLQEAGANAVYISGGTIVGGIPFESRTSSGGTIVADFSSSASGSPCIKINGGGGLHISGTGFGCSDGVVAFVSETTTNTINLNYSGAPSPLYTGTPSVVDLLFLNTTGGPRYIQIPAPTIMGGGYNLLISPVAPTISTHFNTSGDSITQNGTASILVVTGTGVGTSTGTLTMPAAANGWSCWINGGGVSFPTETGTTSTSVTFTNYNASLAPTNWTSSFPLRIGCMAY
jgi:hypothetical protein